MSFEKLITGFRDFQSEYFAGNTELFEKLVMDGQSPEALVIACSDSRIDPGIVTKAEPGDIFSVRNVAALVAPHRDDGLMHGTASAIDYAVDVLRVQYIVVMGHALCGGIRALAESGTDLEEKTDSISRWISIGIKARNMVRKALPDAPIAEQARTLEQAAILVSLRNLMTHPSVARAVEEGRLELHGWYFDIPNGKILGYDSGSMTFHSILDEGFAPAISGCGGACDCTAPTVSVKSFLDRIKNNDVQLDEESLIVKASKRRRFFSRVKKLAYASGAVGAMAAGIAAFDEIIPLIGSLT